MKRSASHRAKSVTAAAPRGAVKAAALTRAETAGASSKYFRLSCKTWGARHARAAAARRGGAENCRFAAWFVLRTRLSRAQDHDPMILAAYICEHGAIVSQATNHATSPDGAGATLDSLLRARVQELSQVGGSAASTCVGDLGSVGLLEL